MRLGVILKLSFVLLRIRVSEMAKKCKAGADYIIKTVQRRKRSSSVADTMGRIQTTKHTGERSEGGSMNALALILRGTRSVEKQHRDWRNYPAAFR